jgi:hypothetical protein
VQRFFVKVYSPDRAAVRRLQSYDFDFFQPTVRETGDKRFQIEGLLNLKEIERLVLDGYQVLVEEESSKRARGPRRTIEFKEWLAARRK